MEQRQELTRRQMVGAAGTAGVALAVGGVRLGGLSPGDAAEEALAATCVMTPAKTVGPYFVDERLNRSDVRESQKGIRLTLTMYVFDADKDCAPVAGAQVDIWHCNAAGQYSDESANGTAGQTWLRGFQTTDSSGGVRFTTIYPGWYQGRAIHIHYKVRVYDGTTETLEFTSQMFFTDAQNSQVVAAAPYSTRGAKPDVTDGSDSIYGNDQSLLLQPTGSNAAGYAAQQFSVGVRKATSQLGNTSAGGGPGGAPPSGGPGTRNDAVVNASLASITSVHVSGRRQLKLAVTSAEPVRAVVTLARSGRTLAHTRGSLAVGTHDVRLMIGSGVAVGAATLRLVLTDAAGNSKTIRRTVHVRTRQ